MTESGTFIYDPDLAEMFDEAVEIAGVDPSVTGGAHIKSGLRSLRLLLNSEWATIGIRNWMVTQETHTTAVGETSFTLPAGGMDIVEAVLRRFADFTINSQYSDVEMYAITRNEYYTLVTKQNQGRPDRYWVERLADTKVVHYWQAGSNTTDQIVYSMFQQNQDVTTAMGNTLGLPIYAHAALVMGWATKLALKWNPQKYSMLMEVYAGPRWSQDPLNPGGLLGMLRTEDRERGDIDTYPAFEPRVGRR